MTVLNKYITNVLFLGLFLFASCEDKIEKKEKIFLSNAIEQLSVNQQYEWVILLPGMGCHGCIQEAEFFMKKHISNEKILFVLTNIESLKILQQKTGVEINHILMFILIGIINLSYRLIIQFILVLSK